jgi:hypothetical protein
MLQGSLTLWTLDEDQLIVAGRCFDPMQSWSDLLLQYSEQAKHAPASFPKVELCRNLVLIECAAATAGQRADVQRRCVTCSVASHPP